MTHSTINSSSVVSSQRHGLFSAGVCVVIQALFICCLRCFWSVLSEAVHNDSLNDSLFLWRLNVMDDSLLVCVVIQALVFFWGTKRSWAKESHFYLANGGQVDALVCFKLIHLSLPGFSRVRGKGGERVSFLKLITFISVRTLQVGIDKESKELIVSIIDYVRLYTWDKRLETLVKSTGILGGAGKMPTAVFHDQVYMPTPSRGYSGVCVWSCGLCDEECGCMVT